MGNIAIFKLGAEVSHENSLRNLGQFLAPWASEGTGKGNNRESGNENWTSDLLYKTRRQPHRLQSVPPNTERRP